MTSANRKNYTLALMAAETIRKFWRTHPDACLYSKPKVEVIPDTSEIKSNIVNGYPPLVSEIDHAR